MIRSILIISVAILFLASCKSTSKRVTKNITPLEYDYYKSKSKVNFKDSKGNNFTFTMNMRSKKDSIIWASVMAPLGIEVARIKITKDSATVVNKLKKEYYLYSVQELTAQVNYPIAFENLQQLLMGELMYKITADNKIRKDSGMHIITQKINDITVENYFNQQLKRVTKIEGEKDDNSFYFNVEYDEFSSVDEQVLPLKESFHFKNRTAEGTEETSIQIEFSKIELPKEKLSFPFYIGDSYVKK